jgi:hypothetical protein
MDKINGEQLLQMSQQIRMVDPVTHSFTDEFKQLLIRAGYTEIDGEFWHLGDEEGDDEIPNTTDPT